MLWRCGTGAPVLPAGRSGSAPGRSGGRAGGGAPLELRGARGTPPMLMLGSLGAAPSGLAPLEPELGREAGCEGSSVRYKPARFSATPAPALLLCGKRAAGAAARPATGRSTPQSTVPKSPNHGNAASAARLASEALGSTRVVRGRACPRPSIASPIGGRNMRLRLCGWNAAGCDVPGTSMNSISVTGRHSTCSVA